MIGYQVQNIKKKFIRIKHTYVVMSKEAAWVKRIEVKQSQKTMLVSLKESKVFDMIWKTKPSTEPGQNAQKWNTQPPLQSINECINCGSSHQPRQYLAYGKNR